MKLLITDRNFFVFFIDFQNYEVVSFAEFQNVRRRFNVVPRKVAYVRQAVKTVYDDERAELSESCNGTRNDIVFCNVCEEFRFFCGSFSVAFSLFGFQNNFLRSDDFFSSRGVFDFKGFAP